MTRKSFFKRESKHANYSKNTNVKTENELFDIIKNLSTPPFILILDNIQDPHNLGACLRTADAAGIDAVVAPKDRSVSLTDTVRRIACGAAEHVPLIQVTNLVRTMKELKKAGLWLVGTTDSAQECIYDIDLSGPLALVMGSEGKGLRRLTMENCDFLAYIPMSGSVDCLNVSVATGVCLFERVSKADRIQAEVLTYSE